MSDMLVDVHEPDDAVPLLGQSLEAVKEPINQQGYADYLWTGTDGREQCERKQWQEILGDMDSVEDQLRREVQAHPDVRTFLVIEGVATPDVQGSKVWTLSKARTRQVLYPTHNHRTSMSKAYAWIVQVQKFMEVYFTPTFHATTVLLVAAYNSAQKEEHTTFNRYLRNIDWHPNPQVEGLMNISRGVGIGPARAQALIKRFGTMWNVLNQIPMTLATVDNMGEQTARKLLRKIGRPDV